METQPSGVSSPWHWFLQGFAGPEEGQSVLARRDGLARRIRLTPQGGGWTHGWLGLPTPKVRVGGWMLSSVGTPTCPPRRSARLAGCVGCRSPPKQGRR